jgi:Gpi18-like mannosyltransferase
MSRRIASTALIAFITSRALFFALVIAGSQIAMLGKAYSDSMWLTRIDLMSARVVPEMVRTTLIADGWFYRSIWLNGYSRSGASGPAPDWAFFPLYPLTVKAAAFTGEFALDAMIVSNVAVLIALLLLGAVAVRAGLTEEDAQRAIVYLAFFPTSYFFALPLTESLFLALSLGAVLAAQSERWPLAGSIGALAALTRFAGILLVPVLAILYLQQNKRLDRRVSWLLLAPCGTIAFMAYLRYRTGDALAFIHAQVNWARSSTWFWEPLAAYVRNPATITDSWNLYLVNFIVAMALLVAGVSMLFRREWAFAAYTLGSILLPLTAGSLQSIGRYAIVVFPFFLWLAVLARRSSIDRAVLPAFATMYGCMIVLFIAHLDFALA